MIVIRSCEASNSFREILINAKSACPGLVAFRRLWIQKLNMCGYPMVPDSTRLLMTAKQRDKQPEWVSYQAPRAWSLPTKNGEGMHQKIISQYIKPAHLAPTLSSQIIERAQPFWIRGSDDSFQYPHKIQEMLPRCCNAGQAERTIAVYIFLFAECPVEEKAVRVQVYQYRSLYILKPFP